MGDWLAGATQTKNSYQASNPYAPDQLADLIAKSKAVYGGQTDLAGTLKAQVAGGGPQPAQTAFLRNVAANAQRAQGLATSQRGINPALAARLGVNAEAAGAQEAAGTAAQLTQEQQLASEGQLANVYGTMGGQNNQQQGLYVGAQQGADAANLSAQLANQKAAQGIVGGIAGGAGAAAGLMKAKGGMIPRMAAKMRYAPGGRVEFPPMTIEGSPLPSGPMNDMRDIVSKIAEPVAPMAGAPQSRLAMLLKRPQIGNEDPVASGFTKLGAGLGDAFSNRSPAQEPKGSEMTPSSPAVEQQARGGMTGARNFKPGGRVPGQAKKAGDSYDNDTVDAKLSPGEVVIPRSVTKGKDPVKNGAKFLAAVLAKKGRRAS